jgi:hypothetical protein
VSRKESDGSASAKSIQPSAPDLKGFLVFDWPLCCPADSAGCVKVGSCIKQGEKCGFLILSIHCPLFYAGRERPFSHQTTQTSTAEVVREQVNPALKSFSHRQVVPLGICSETVPKIQARPRVCDTYAHDLTRTKFVA